MKKLLILFILIPSLVLSQLPEPEKNTYVNDQYGYLRGNEMRIINSTLRTIEDSFGIQIAIVLIPSLPERYNIEDYARGIGRKWHVGNAKNGIVYVAAIDQHKQRMEIAEHLEGTIPDLTAAHFLDHLKPYFRAQKYGEGLVFMVVEMTHMLLEAKQEQKKLTADELKKKKQESRWPWWVWIGLWVGVSVSATFIVRRVTRNMRLKQQILDLEIGAQEKRAQERRLDAIIKERMDQINHPGSNAYVPPAGAARPNTYTDEPTIIIPPIIPDDIGGGGGKSYGRGDDTPSSGGYSSNNGRGSSGSIYGDFGSGSSDSTSDSGSGYSGGGASDNW